MGRSETRARQAYSFAVKHNETLPKEFRWFNPFLHQALEHGGEKFFKKLVEESPSLQEQSKCDAPCWFLTSSSIQGHWLLLLMHLY
jgi:hypothetical protein